MLDPNLYNPGVKRSRVFQVVMVVIIIGVASMAVGAWLTLVNQTRARQPLEVIACEAGTFVHGMTQDQCVRPMSRDAFLKLDETVLVAGDICLDSDEPIRYDVVVEWVALEQDGVSFRVFEFPTTWNPGCDPEQAYDFPYTVPEALQAVAPPEGGSLGLWRIVGTATPQNNRNGLILRYQWDVTDTFELIADPALEELDE